MILRRFMQHIREQNWFAVGLDVIVVIVGIFLGLQVQAAYEEQQSLAEEKRLIEAIAGEVEEIIAIRQTQIQTLQDDQSEVVEALSILFDEKNIENLTDRHCSAIRRSHSRSTSWSTIPISSVEEIVVSGKLNIVRNPKLRSAILTLRSISTSVSTRIDLVTNRDVILYSKFPDVIQTIYSTENSDGILSRTVCDFENIKLNSGFLNDLQANRGRKGVLINHASEELSALMEVLRLING